MGNSDEYQRAKGAALRLLGLCDRSRKDLRERLLKKGYSGEVVNTVLSEMESMGYINDERFALNFAMNAINIKNYGPQAISSGLQKKGITCDIIDNVMEKVFPDNTEKIVAQKALGKRLRKVGISLQRDEIRRVADYLRRKGFSYDIIKKTISEIETDDDI